MKYKAPSMEMRSKALKAFLADRSNLKTRNALVSMHLWLIGPTVNRYSKVWSSDQNEMFNEGVLGLIDAADKFDESHKVEFSTFATFYVRNRIQGVITSDRSFAYCRPGCHVNQARVSRDKRRDDYNPLETVMSLDAPVSADGGEDSLHSLIKSNSEPPDALVRFFERRDQVRLAVKDVLSKKKDPRFKTIAFDRILTDDPLPLSQVGLKINLSKEGVRLKESSLMNDLKAVLEQRGVTI